jgi:hypothetical protein
MRTVAFSDAGIVKVLGDKFVCAWANKRPDLKFKDDLYGTCWVPRGLRNGAAAANVTCVFATADGRLIHAVPGYLDANGLKRHVEFATSLHETLLKAAPEDRTTLVIKAHLAAARRAPNREEKSAHELLSKGPLWAKDLALDHFDAVGNIFV